MADKPSTDVAKFDPTSSQFPVLFSADEGEGSVAQVLADNFGETGFSTADLDRVTVPAGGGTTWEVPDEAPTRELDGIIVHKQTTRAFWTKKRGEDGEDDGPPDCYSGEGTVGHGMFGVEANNPDNPTGACETCPMNKFESAREGKGKACKEQVQVFLLQEGAVLPIQVSLPPTSLKGFRKYMTRLAQRSKSYFAVVTRLTLKVEKGNGNTYSVVEPAKLAELGPEEVAAARGYGGTIRGLLEKAAAERAATEVNPETAGGADAPGRTAPLEESVR